MTTKAERATINEWRGLIGSRPAWALRAAIRMVELQTEEEKNTRATLQSNGVGLNAFDAEIITSIVQWHLAGKSLSKKQMDTLRRSMPKYAAQLYRLTYPR